MKKINWLKLILSIVICQLAGIIGGIFTAGSVKTWYVTLVKPDFNPPGWLFAPVWIALYLLMGIAFYKVWNSTGKGKMRKAMIVFIIQLILNSIWSFIFFGIHNITLAFVEILVLWIMIAYSIKLFYPISRWAAYLLLPYLLWVSFASVLTYEIMRFNR